MSPQTIAHYRITAKLCEVAMSAARYPDIGSLVLEVFAGFDGSSFRVVIRHRQASENSTWQ